MSRSQQSGIQWIKIPFIGFPLCIPLTVCDHPASGESLLHKQADAKIRMRDDGMRLKSSCLQLDHRPPGRTAVFDILSVLLQEKVSARLYRPRHVCLTPHAGNPTSFPGGQEHDPMAACREGSSPMIKLSWESMM